MTRKTSTSTGMPDRQSPKLARPLLEESQDQLHSILAGKKILVTGASGYVAVNIFRLLQGIPCNITRWTRQDKSLPPLQGQAQVRDFVGDYADIDVWRLALSERTDAVVHLAAQTSVYKANDDPNGDWRANVLPLLNLLEVCRQTGRNPAVVFAGTVTQAGLPEKTLIDETIQDAPVTMYDFNKLTAEQMLEYYDRHQHVRGATLRLANVYGPGPPSSSSDRGLLNMMVKKAIRGEELTIYGAGEEVRDYVFVEDVARAFLNAIACIDRIKGQSFCIGTGTGHSIADAVKLVAQRVNCRRGSQVKAVHVDSPDGLSEINKRSFVVDSRRFQEATNWRPTTELADGIDRTIESVVANRVEGSLSAAG